METRSLSLLFALLGLVTVPATRAGVPLGPPGGDAAGARGGGLTLEDGDGTRSRVAATSGASTLEGELQAASLMIPMAGVASPFLGRTSRRIPAVQQLLVPLLWVGDESVALLFDLPGRRPGIPAARLDRSGPTLEVRTPDQVVRVGLRGRLRVTGELAPVERLPAGPLTAGQVASRDRQLRMRGIHRALVVHRLQDLEVLEARLPPPPAPRRFGFGGV